MIVGVIYHISVIQLITLIFWGLIVLAALIMYGIAWVLDKKDEARKAKKRKEQTK